MPSGTPTDSRCAGALRLSRGLAAAIDPLATGVPPDGGPGGG